MSRIEGDKINLGNSFVLSSEGRTGLNKEITDAKLIADSIIVDAKNQAQNIIAQAQQQSQAILSKAETEAEASKDDILAESRRQGYEEGYEDGKEKITTELENLVYNVNNFAKCKFDIKQRIIKSLHNDILDMVLEISEKICKVELQENRKVLIRVVANAISQLKEKENVTIIVNPEMAQKIYDISENLKESIQNLEHIKIIEDNSVSTDGTIVESVGSRVDARVRAQIEQIAQKLFAELNAAPEIELAREVEEEFNDINDKPDEI